VRSVDIRRVRHTAHRGFTLLEVIVALSLGAVIVLGARLMVENVAGSASRIGAHVRAADEDANGERLLRLLVGAVYVSAKEETAFAGNEQAASFSSWCETASGWQERCRLSLEISPQGSGSVLVARWSQGRSVTLRRATRAMALRYLVDARQGGTWFTSWASGFTTPRAIGVLIDGDTLIVRIGDRG
jgi:prepilin-type N-terminal cleavage/methylation domain-containing protein